MADKKVTQLASITSTSGDDLLYVVNSPALNPSSSKISIKNLFGTVAVNTAVSGTFTTSANATLGGTTLTISANTVVKGTNVLSAINDRMQVSNVQTLYATYSYTERYLEVANANFISSDGTANASVVAVSANAVSISNGHGLTVNAGGVTDMVPVTSNAATESIAAGTIWYSNNHLYIATDENTIKRVALSTF